MTTTTPAPQILPYGDHAVFVKWATGEYSGSVNDTVHALAAMLRDSGKYTEVVPGYDSLVCVFDLAKQSAEDTKLHIENILAHQSPDKMGVGRLVEIPVNYGGHYGPDIHTICEAAKLTVDDVIATHSTPTYRVCMMGFIPGFTFLSPAPIALHHPRHSTPRSKVPAGSVGIANWQTGIYGLESPGGWQIIGQTPLSIFDAKRETPFLLEAGDRVRFIPQ